MEVEWDRRKAEANLRKHAVDFSEAATVFYDDLAVTISAEDVGEPRFVTLGMSAFGRVLVVVYTWRGDTPRLISARKAARREHVQYGSRGKS